MAALLLDLDGVIYGGDAAIAGAAEAVTWFEQRGVPHLFLTNTTSRPREALVEKLTGFGISTEASSILTPPVAARHWLRAHVDGPVALFVPPATAQEFAGLDIAGEDAEQHVGAAVVGDLGERWDFATLNRAFRLLLADPRPALVALGLTRFWQAPDGLRLDTGPFVKALEYAAGAEAVVMGKPAAPFFQAGLEMLGAAPDQAVMVGDDIRGDIEGAAAAGLRTVLVRTGKFRPGDLDQGIAPDAVIDSVAELPAWWRANMNARGQ
jgi:phospholysine phosphohistidine inorganic pyrophosphate phosphatase